MVATVMGRANNTSLSGYLDNAINLIEKINTLQDWQQDIIFRLAVASLIASGLGMSVSLLALVVIMRKTVPGCCQKCCRRVRGALPSMAHAPPSFYVSIASRPPDSPVSDNGHVKRIIIAAI